MVLGTGVAPLAVSLEDVCFLHWGVPESVVDALLPSWLTPDTVDGDAWISALAMTMGRFDVFGHAAREDVHALNLRTYVRSPAGNRGVYFLSLDATDRPVVEAARRLFRVPYYYADVARWSFDGADEPPVADRSRGFESSERDGDAAGVRVARRDDEAATLGFTYRVSGPTRTASPDTLASFLTERYRYYAEGPFGRRLVGSVGHDPWALQSASATVTHAGLLSMLNVSDADEHPLAHCSEGTEMKIGPRNRCRGPSERTFSLQIQAKH